METNFIIEITYKHIFLEIKTYYEFTIDQLDIFEQWYNTFDIFFYNDLEISRDLLIYKLIETKEEIDLAKKFIDTFGRPFEILEEIDDLNELFNIDDSYSDKSENSCYEETETINDIIKAHINGDTIKVKNLLNKTTIDDDIVNDLKKKYD
jgi:hypothetical protein